MTRQADPAPNAPQLAWARLNSTPAYSTRTGNCPQPNAPVPRGDTGDTTEQPHAPDA